MEASKTNLFAGMSSLRAEERTKQPPTEKAKALAAYLEKYSVVTTKGEHLQADGPKKRKKKKSAAPIHGFTIIDNDNTGFKDPPSKRTKKVEEDEGEEDDAPVIANPGEAELYARLLEKEKSGAVSTAWAAVGEEPSSSAGMRLPSSTQRSTDTSPPRRQRHDSPDASPPRRQRHDSPDTSPPRRQRYDSPDASPTRRQRHDSPDTSPPRRQRHDSPDASPPRRQRHDSSDASPPRRQGPPDASPPRKRRDVGQAAGDISPPRKRRQQPGKTLADGITAGMVSGNALAAQLEAKRVAERERFEKLEAANNFTGAETVYRDKETGKRMSKAEFEAAQKQALDKKRATYEVPKWGGGMQQMRNREEQSAAMAREASKQFARTRDDVDEELNLKDRARFGDPMAHLVKRRAQEPLPAAIPEHMVKLMKKSGFVVPQDVPSHSWLKRGMGPPPNRYGIKPGRHWDGVDRSTGFERDMFKQQAARAALEREARMWSQSDM